MELDQVIVKGFITKDVEVKTSKSGNAYARFRIGCNHWDRDKQQSEASFFNVIAFGKNTDLLRAKGKKGQEIIVTGKLVSQTWKDVNGNTRETVSIKAFGIELIEKFKAVQEAPDDRQKTGLEVQKEPVSAAPISDKPQHEQVTQSEQSNGMTNISAANQAMEDPFANQDSLDIDLDESDIPF